jgi:hypothetical protein
MTVELDWCGQPIGPRGCYGGRPEHISSSWNEKPAQPAAKQHYCVVTERYLVEIFGNGTRELRRSEAAKHLELLTKAHKTSCYSALKTVRSHRREGTPDAALGIVDDLRQEILPSHADHPVTDCSQRVAVWICAVQAKDQLRVRPSSS